jgi:hypothetical protein
MKATFYLLFKKHSARSFLDRRRRTFLKKEENINYKHELSAFQNTM